MIDFENSPVIKLRSIAVKEVDKKLLEFLVEGEQVFAAFKTVRDQLIFTNKRVISVNVQGITGKKRDYTSIPFSKVQTFSVETAGTFDMDSDLTLYVSSVGKIRFEISGGVDIIGLNKLISRCVL